MVKVEVKCPEYGDVKISKNGKTETGAQHYICNNKDCQCKSFMLEYIYNGNKHGIENQIIAMAANASGIRDTARVLGISTDKVISTIKNSVGNKPRILWSLAGASNTVFTVDEHDRLVIS